MSTFRLIKRIAHGKPEIDDTHQLYWESEQKKLYVSADGVWYPIGQNLEKYVIKKNLPHFYDEDEPYKDGSILSSDLIAKLIAEGNIVPPQDKLTYPTTSDKVSRLVALFKQNRNAFWKSRPVGNRQLPKDTTPLFCNIGDTYFKDSIFENNDSYEMETVPAYSSSSYSYVFFWFMIKGKSYFYYTGYSYNSNTFTVSQTLYDNIYSSYDDMKKWFYKMLGEVYELPIITEELLDQTRFDLYFSEPKFRIRIENVGPNGGTQENSGSVTQNLKVRAKFDEDADQDLTAIISQDSTYTLTFDNSVNISSSLEGASADSEKHFRVFNSNTDKEEFLNLTNAGFMYAHNFNQTVENFIYFPEISKHFRITLFALPRCIIPSDNASNGEKNIFIVIEETIMEEIPESDTWSLE
jgi:hypothetical protein